MRIRLAETKDLEELVQVEAVCFPEAEAAGKAAFAGRLEAFPKNFWVLEDEGRIAGFINGMVTDEKTIRDEMFEDAGLHQEKGAYQSVFGLDVLPEYRRRGLGGELMRTLIRAAVEEGRKGCILTCKKGLIPYYESFGYRCLGKSESTHGGAVWFDMILEPVDLT